MIWTNLTWQLMGLGFFRIAPVYGCVVFVAWYFGSRRMLILGLIGAALGPIFVPPYYYGDKHIEIAKITANQWQLIGGYFAFLACLNSWAWDSKPKSENFQFSTRMALLLTLNLAAILGILNAINPPLR